MNGFIRILLVDDHEVVLSGLRELINSGEHKYDITTASSAEEALEKLSAFYQKPDVIITDLDMESLSGRDLCKKVAQEYPSIKTLVLSMHTEKGIVRELIKAGAHGYLSKTCGKAELHAAVNAVLRGKKFYSTDVLESLSQDDEKPEVNMFLRHLSARELEILKLTANGLSSKEIGDSLNISHRTVETHRNNIIKKLEVKNVAGLIKVAVKSGLID
ncbi:MAG: response regulator [Bacteroidia bacterium]